MRVLLVAVGSRGDVQPFVALGWRRAARQVTTVRRGSWCGTGPASSVRVGGGVEQSEQHLVEGLLLVRREGA